VWPEQGSNQESVGQLLTGFFEYFLSTFPVMSDVVVVTHAAAVTKRAKDWTGHSLAVEGARWL
jgi:hypothetical protein